MKCILLDLDKAVDRVAREVTRLTVRSEEEWLVNAVMVVYECAQTIVRIAKGNSKAFCVKVVYIRDQY